MVDVMASWLYTHEAKGNYVIYELEEEICSKSDEHEK
jgi:hypothetical protein